MCAYIFYINLITHTCVLIYSTLTLLPIHVCLYILQYGICCACNNSNKSNGLGEQAIFEENIQNLAKEQISDQIY